MVSAGNGSNSDGIYSGTDMLDGAPFYSFSLATYFDYPQALGACNDTLIIGSGNSLSYCVRDTSIVSFAPGTFLTNPKSISTPDNPFGVEMPYVSDIVYSSRMGGYMVAGYDKSPEPAEGSLLLGNSQTLYTTLGKSTTSIYETFSEFTGSVTYVGGADRLYSSFGGAVVNDKRTSVPIDIYTEISTPNDSKVNHVTGVYQSQIVIGGADICISIDDGVYVLDGTDTWTELGDIPEKPNMTVSQFIGKSLLSNLYAATDKGVYKYALY